MEIDIWFWNNILIIWFSKKYGTMTQLKQRKFYNSQTLPKSNGLNSKYVYFFKKVKWIYINKITQRTKSAMNRKKRKEKVSKTMRSN